MALTIGTGVTIGTGISVTGESASPPGPTNPYLSLDAGNYSGSGPWIDGYTGSTAFTLYGSPSWSNSIGGGSFLFNGSGQYAQCNNPNLGSYSTWTIQVWMYHLGVTGPAAAIFTEVFPGTTSNINYSLGNNRGGLPGSDPNYLYSGFYNGAWRTTADGITLTPNNWYFLAGTYDGTANKLYINGSLVSSVAYSGTPISSGGGIRLMRRWDTAEYWQGRLAIAKVANFAYTATDITNNWNANKSRFGL